LIEGLHFDLVDLTGILNWHLFQRRKNSFPSPQKVNGTIAGLFKVPLRH
jgi:hypothetical protein